ncbi:MAG TPA: rod shape-determining protein MreC [Anaerolineae bacterium]|nr:rod shape-determining protein MreC [Anaerolineae bacterium]
MNRRRQRPSLMLASLALVWLASALLRLVPGADMVAARVDRALSPLQSGLSFAAARLRLLAQPGQDAVSLREEVRRLSAELDRLQVETQQLDDLKRENRELREQLGFRRLRPDLDLEGASIVGRSIAAEPGPVLRSIKMDIGSRDGVAERMTVVSHRGLVGQVLRLDERWSDVMLITHPRSRIRGRIGRSQATGIVFGLPGGDLVMRHIPQDPEGGPPNVQVGDIVETSGMSQRFPGQITIGQVVKVRQDDVAKWQEASIRPSVDFDALELVMVVTAWRPSAQGSGDPGADGAPDDVDPLLSGDANRLP